MRGLLLVLTIALSSPAWGQEHAGACAQIAKNARTVMGARQDGVPAEKMMEPVLAMPEESKAKPILRRMTLDAYGQTRWHSEESKQRAVEDFGNEWYMVCMETLE